MSHQNRIFMHIARFLSFFYLILFQVHTLCAQDEWSPHFFSEAEKNYIELQKIVPMYEKAVLNPWASVPDVPFKLNTKNWAVLALRGRLEATGDLRPENNNDWMIYNKAVFEAVKHFQSRHGLDVDGIVGKATLYELNISPEKRLQQLQININRWAKLSGELGSRYMMVNIPAFQLDLIENGEKILSMKAIVGRPSRPTPELSSTVTRMVLNPYWNIPKMIAQEDIIPKVIQNSNYLDSMGIKIFNRQYDDVYQIFPDEINWDTAKYEGFAYQLRQDPGANNALGLVKFEFRNSKDIYLHDTPAKALFNRDKRAYSSGCVRLEKPFELVNYLMQDNPDWSNEKLLDILMKGKTKYITASRPTKVIITYLTVWVDDKGTIQFRDDLYGLDETRWDSIY